MSGFRKLFLDIDKHQTMNIIYYMNSVIMKFLGKTKLLRKSMQWIFVIFVFIPPNISPAQEWVMRYNGPGNADDYAWDIAVDNVGNVYVTGKSQGSGTGYCDYATVKYDSLGVEQWVARYNGLANSYDAATSIAVDNAGNVYVTGMSMGYSTAFDYATVKYDSLGVEQWVARYNGPRYNSDYANAIAVNNAVNIHITGYRRDSGTFRYYTTMKYDASGIEQWAARYDGPGDPLGDGATAIVVDGTGNVCITGWSLSWDTGIDYATIKYSPTGIEESRTTQIKSSSLHATIFSGPLQLLKDKECKVFDITGRVVEPTRITRGIYFIEIDGVVIQKVVKVR